MRPSFARNASEIAPKSGKIEMRLVNRTLAAALSGLLLVTAAVPAALAGEAELRFLEQLLGNWRGSGEISGPDGGDVTCRLVLKPSGSKVNFNGRCALAGGGGSQSFSGSIRYNDRAGRWESSSRGETVAGKKSGNNLVFTTAQSDRRGSGTSTMTLSPGAISVKFDLVDKRTGEKTQGSIPFRKS